ncbi:hypothetical protein V6N13_112276 [Hibiscus sabdariffa]|uniref:Uncharacterized protein n=1 Tax=Hibiscus sabdariffa TaxID=183260 RepID=A0ABR2TMN6_9ROSI
MVKLSPSTATIVSCPYLQTHPGNLSNPAEISCQRQALLVDISRGQTVPIIESKAMLIARSICFHLRGQTAVHTVVRFVV